MSNCKMILEVMNLKIQKKSIVLYTNDEKTQKNLKYRSITNMHKPCANQKLQ